MTAAVEMSAHRVRHPQNGERCRGPYAVEMSLVAMAGGDERPLVIPVLLLPDICNQWCHLSLTHDGRASLPRRRAMTRP